MERDPLTWALSTAEDVGPPMPSIPHPAARRKSKQRRERRSPITAPDGRKRREPGKNG